MCRRCAFEKTMYRELDMPFWLEQAEAELTGTRRPS